GKAGLAAAAGTGPGNATAVVARNSDMLSLPLSADAWGAAAGSLGRVSGRRECNRFRDGGVNQEPERSGVNWEMDRFMDLIDVARLEEKRIAQAVREVADEV